MYLGPAATPKPLPIQRGGNPSTWANTPLVHFKAKYFGRTVPGTYIGASLGNEWRKGELPPDRLTDARAYTPLGNVTFREAVLAASAASRPRVLGGGLVQATAVLQAGDGAYYLAALASRTSDGKLTFVSVDRHDDVAIKDLAAANPDLRAVVGAHAWVNFTSTPLQVSLAD